MSSETLTIEEGKLLITIARENISSYLNHDDYELPSQLPEIFHENLGVFVTLNKFNSLRGCIGYPEPIKSLIDAVLDVSIAAAVEDPRFYPLTIDELKDIEIEISVLTKPREVIVENPEDYLKILKVGVDGLIIENGYHKGLLLPQVPIEQNWNIEEFLENLCYKAGLPSNTWKNPNTKIYNFQAQIFNE